MKELEWSQHVYGDFSRRLRAAYSVVPGPDVIKPFLPNSAEIELKY